MAENKHFKPQEYASEVCVCQGPDSIRNSVSVCECSSGVLPLLEAVAVTAAATVPLGKLVVLGWQGGRPATLWFGTTMPAIIPQH